MITSDYFSDIEPVTSGIYKNYRGHLIKRSPQNYSVELIASGTMYFQREPEDQHLLSTPMIRWQEPGNIYNYGSVDDVGWEHYFFLYRGPRARRVHSRGFYRLSEHAFLPVRRVDLFRGLFTAIHHTLLSPRIDNARAVICLEQILLHAAEEAAGLPSESRYTSDLERICSQIHLDPGKDICFEKQARDMGLSVSHFRKCFSEHTGMAPHQYLLRARLRAAADRLCRTPDPIKGIAYDLNLGNPAQFSKAFRSQFGMPPGAYRKTFSDSG